MSVLIPFRAVHYNPEKVSDISKVVSPPYDVISEEDQNFYHALSPYNFTHIDLGKDKPNDDRYENKYVRANKMFKEWLKKGVMVQDETPSIYFYRQDYKVMGQKYSRLGFISLMKLEDPQESKVYPHENTHKTAVEDRLKLTKTLTANLSSIFVCYADNQRRVEKIFNKDVVVHNPLFDVDTIDKTRHRLWRVEDAGIIREINTSIRDQNLFIADGHHRYKVAQEYRQLRLKRKPGAGSKEPYNYVMTYFTNLDSKDLQILPIHRIIKKVPKNLDFLEKYFRIDKVNHKDDLAIFLAKAGKNEHTFGLYRREGVQLLRLRSKLIIDQYIKDGSPEYKELDATILKNLVLDKIGVASEDIVYSNDMKEAMRMVNSHEAEVAFIMNPVKISQLKSVALNGERMPPKTTFFYPKVLSGLTVYLMN